MKRDPLRKPEAGRQTKPNASALDKTQLSYAFHGNYLG